MNKILILSALAVLSGCASTEVAEATRHAHDTAERTLAAAGASARAGAAAPIVLPMQDVPYLPQKSRVRGSYKAELPAILRSTAPVHFAMSYRLSLQEFARLVAEEFKIPVKVADEGAPASGAVAEARIDLASLPSMPRKEFITTVTHLMGTDWDWQDGTLLIQRAFTRTYAVSTSPENNESKIKSGKRSDATAGATGTGAGTGGNFSNELTSSSEFKVDAWSDLQNALATITGNPKAVVIGRAFNSVTVTCAKACHRVVKQFIDNVNHSLNQQVLLNVKEVTVQSTKTGESGINWNMVYQTVLDSHKFSFALSTPTSLVSDQAGQVRNIIVPRDPNNLKNIDGSQFIVQALSGASKFVDVKPYSQLVVNNDTTTLTNIAQQSYTQSFTVVPSSVLGGTPQYVGNPGYATFGQILQVSPTILPDGNIKIGFSLDDTSGKVEKGAGTAGAPVPDTVTSSAVNVNTRFIVKPGSTIILSNFKRSTNRSQNQGLLAGQKLGSETGTEEVTETLVLITPYIANVGAL